jgi:5-deoxy-5-amino-3-dehydroquinate synthase
VTVGGGVVSDTAGFAAAVYHRGVAVIHVPTTLLGQVDAAIGGKTGVNLREGKNLVGAFWQPAAVLCDTETLASLPEREYLSGCGEMAKYAFLGVDGLRDLPLEDAVAACVACKAEFVSGDERESIGTDRRALLNYGHTLAHALETAGEYDLRHGEAVSIGLVYAARLARRLGRIDGEEVQLHLDVVGRYGLPSALPSDANAERLLELMGRDKKALNGLTFVLSGPRGVEVVAGVPLEDAAAALLEMR